MNFGVIGTNFISDSFVESLPFAASAATAVFSRKKTTGEAFAKRHGIPYVFDDPDAFLSSEHFDAVYVASPNFCHEEQSIRALAHGKHVLCEKPAAPSLAGFLRICEQAKKHGRVFMEAMRPLHDTFWQEIREMLPRIGAIRGGRLEFCQYSSRYGKHLAGEYTNTFDPSLSNAALLDIGIYPIAIAVWLFGAPRGVCGSSVMLDNGFEGAGDIVLDYGTHTLSIGYSKVSNSLLPSAILGEEGGITVDKLTFPTEACLRLRTGECITKKRATTDAPSNMHEEVIDFIRAVSRGDILPMQKECADALAIADSVRRKAGIRFPSDGEDLQ